MLSDFLFLNNRGLNCMETCLVNTAKHFRNNYTLLFTQCFDLQFPRLTPNMELPQEIQLINPVSLDMLRTYYCINNNEEWNLRNAIPIIQSQLNANKPVLLRIDYAYCRWFAYNKNEPFKGFILITDISKTDYEIVDPIRINQKIRLPINDFIRGFDMIYYFMPFELQEYNPLKELQLFVSQIDFNSSFDNIRYTLEHYTEYTSVFTKNLPVLIKIIAGKRSLFSELLEECAKNDSYRSGTLQEMAQSFLNVRKNWIELANTLIKLQLSNQVETCRLLQYIDSIRQIELTLQQKITEL